MLWAEAMRADDWPMLRHDPARSGRSSDSVGPPFNVAWSVVFPEETIPTRTEPIVADGRVYVGTYQGRLYSLHATTGEELWSARLKGPILHSPCVFQNKVYVAGVGGLWALDAQTGKTLWHFSPHRAGFCTSPLVMQDLVLLGGRDGRFCAVDRATGKLRWSVGTGGPIRTSAAAIKDTLFFASEDMHVYAVRLEDGQLLWKSHKLSGQSVRDYYPLLLADRVIIRTNPVEHFATHIAGDTAFLASQAGLPDNHWQTIDQYLKSSAVFGTPEKIRAEQAAIRRRLEQYPWLQTFFILDAKTGETVCIPPVLYVGGCAGVGNPPVVVSETQVFVIYRTAYTNFTLGVAPFVGVGLLDVTTGQIEPIFHQHGLQVPWDTFWGTADEAQNLSSAGPMVYFSHQGTLSALDLRNKKLMNLAGRRDTFGGFRRVDWALNEWHGPARSSAAIAGEYLYWITGSRVIAVKGEKE